MTKEMMNTKEVAEYLNINEKQVYKLTKEKKIPATRITGKWTFPKKLIDDWIVNSAQDFLGAKGKTIDGTQHVVAMGSNDFAMEVLSHELSRNQPEFSLSMSNVGSLQGLIALERGICHIATCHLLDPETGTYNIPFLSRYLSDMEVVAVNLVYRDMGMIVKKDNPKKIARMEDLARSDIRIINRQPGSGTRTFLDYELKRLGIDQELLSGYDNEVNTHTESATAVLSGKVDVSIGILPAANMLGLKFIMLTKERYDLIIPKVNLSSAPINALLETSRSLEFKQKTSQMAGYDTKHTGRIMTN